MRFALREHKASDESVENSIHSIELTSDVYFNVIVKEFSGI